MPASAGVWLGGKRFRPCRGGGRRKDLRGMNQAISITDSVYWIGTNDYETALFAE